MPVDIEALRTELQTDPNSYGYAPLLEVANDAGLAAMLNQVRQTINIPRADITPAELLEAIDVTHFIANPNPLRASWFESLTQASSIRVLLPNGSDARVMTNLLAILTNGSTSETRLRALASRNGSRAEQLFGVDVVVTAEEVGSAR